MICNCVGDYNCTYSGTNNLKRSGIIVTGYMITNYYIQLLISRVHRICNRVGDYNCTYSGTNNQKRQGNIVTVQAITKWHTQLLLFWYTTWEPAQPL